MLAGLAIVLPIGGDLCSWVVRRGHTPADLDLGARQWIAEEDGPSGAAGAALT